MEKTFKPELYVNIKGEKVILYKHELLNNKEFSQLLRDNGIDHTLGEDLCHYPMNKNIDSAKDIFNASLLLSYYVSYLESGHKYDKVDLSEPSKALSYQMKMLKHLKNKDELKIRDYVKTLKHNYPLLDNCPVDVDVIKDCISFLRVKGWKVDMNKNSIAK